MRVVHRVLCVASAILTIVSIPSPVAAQTSEPPRAAVPMSMMVQLPAPSPTPLRLSALRPRRPYQTELVADLPIMAAAAALWIFPEMMGQELYVRTGRCPCDPAILNPIDRPVAGQRLPMPGWISDAWMATLVVTPALLERARIV